MDCKEASGRIRDFISDRLGFREKKDFIRHITACPECYDETEVLLMAEEALRTFSDGQNPKYDLGGLLEKKIVGCRKEIRRRNRFLFSVWVLSTLLLILLLLILIIYIGR